MEKLESAVNQLKAAMDEAEAYVDKAGKLADGINVHKEFLQSCVMDIDRIVATALKKKEAVESPPEVREAVNMIKRLTIAFLEQQHIEKQAADAQREKQLQMQSTEAKETQIVISKAPIPPLQIPIFNGNSIEYKNFITIFDDSVDKNPTLQPSQKLAYLQQYVAGDAKSLIGRIPIQDANYKVAREMLLENYGGEERNISSLFDRLRELKPVTDEPFELRDLHNESETIFRVLKEAGQDIDKNTYVYDELLKKYPFTFLVDVVDKEDMAFSEFREKSGRLIRLRVKLAQRTDNIPQKYRAQTSKPAEKSQQSSSVFSSKQSQPTPLMSAQVGEAANAEKQPFRRPLRSYDRPAPICSFCNDRHYPDECTKYSTIQQRIEILKDRCLQCFRKLHPETPCLRDRPCYFCQRTDHHRALCPSKFGNANRTIQLTALQTETGKKKTKPGKFLTLMAVIENPSNGHTREIRACIDPASDTTVLTQKVAEEMGIEILENIYSSPKGLGGTPLPATSNEEYQIKMHVLNGQPIHLQTRLTTAIAPDLRAPDVPEFRRKFPKHDNLVIPETGRGRGVELLIGTDMLTRIVTLQRSVYVNENNQLLSTRMGYLILQGADSEPEIDEDRVTLLIERDSEIKRMWDLDIIGLKYAEEKDSTFEERALNGFYRTIEFIQKRYQVRWPWRSFPPNLPNNFTLALGRLKSLHRKLTEKKELLSAYDRIIQEQIQEDIVEVVPAHERKTSKLTHYIPHHAVVDLEKTTPVRIVYDASSKLRGYDSLNDSILKGTKWTEDLVSSLLRFRKDRFAVTADIKRAFHQILIHPDERDVMRFLWVKDINAPLTEENIQVFRFKRMAFGVIASPFLLYAVLQYHFTNNPTEENKILAQEMYADNLVVSLPPNIDPLRFYQNTRESFNQMSMDMGKWATNDTRLKEKIPSELQMQEESPITLGLKWNTSTDQIAIKSCKTEHLKGRPRTKRIALKILASLFDPLGWALPVSVRARIFLRKLWDSGYKWDKPLETDLANEWTEIQNSINSATEIRLDRMYARNGPDLSSSIIQLHTFVDASAEAYAAVTYIRIISAEKQSISFVMARARLSPKNHLTIPRLELIAAVAGARLMEYVGGNLHLQQEHKTFLWSDSKCVIAWINTLKILPSVVLRQVQEIRSKQIDEIRYVPSQKNPADIGSRGSDYQTLTESMWIGGPEWLIKECDWPEHQPISETEEAVIDDRTIMLCEKREVKFEIEPMKAPFDMQIQRFSSLMPLLQKTAYRIWVLNTILCGPPENGLQRRDVKFINTETKIDYVAAKKLWIRWDQSQAFPQLRILNRKESTSFQSLKVFKDDDGIIRYLPRLENSQLPEETKTPILLAKKSHLTKLIVMDHHLKNMHAGTSYTLAAVRRSYHLPQGRREIFNILHSYCSCCKRHDARPYKAPPTAPLPSFRIQPTTTPFKNVGIDIFGPITIVSDIDKLKTEKRWVIIFTCLVVRAVHMEVIAKMETNEIISGIRRYVARRGAPKLILTDNAPQFKVLDGVLADLWKKVTQSTQGAKYFAESEIIWKFVPQYAPWMGGVYERLIQSIKNAFHRTYGEVKLTSIQLITATCEIEAIMNSRPITYVDREVNTRIITPNHFLRVQFPAVSIQTDESQHTRRPVVTAVRKHIVTQWKIAEERLDKYWRLWTDHYLLALRESSNTVGSKRPTLRQPKEGEVVLMVDPTTRRGFWRSAVIEKLIRSGDNEVRSAQIRVAGGNRMIRPVTKLAPFEIAEEYTKEDLPETVSPSSFRRPEDGVDEHQNDTDAPLIQLRYGGCEEIW